MLAEKAGIDRGKTYEVFLSSAAAAPAIRYRQQAFSEPGLMRPA